MSQFTAIPSIPVGAISDWHLILLSAMKENLELLIGTRGEENLDKRAITQGQIGINPLDDQHLRQITAEGKGFEDTQNHHRYVDLDDYSKLLIDVQTLANDLANTNAAMNLLIAELRGRR